MGKLLEKKDEKCILEKDFANDDNQNEGSIIIIILKLQFLLHISVKH